MVLKLYIEGIELGLEKKIYIYTYIYTNIFFHMGDNLYFLLTHTYLFWIG